MTKVIFLCKKHVAYGRAYGLRNSATFAANALHSEGVTTQTHLIVDGNDVDRVVTREDPTHVIIEALWVTPDKIKELLSIPRHRKRTWMIRLHSKIPFIANEGMAFDWLVRYAELPFPNLYICPNTKEFTDDLRELVKLRTVFLPNIYCPPRYENIPRKLRKSNKTIDIGCFGAIRPMKNQLIQAVAAAKFADRHGLDLRFHVNGNRCEQQGQQVQKNMESFFRGQSRHLLVQHDWMEHDEFIRVASLMDMGMQVSYSETFNIVAADFVWHGVPTIGSAEITWLPKMFQADPNSSESIAQTLDRAWSWYGYPLRKLSKRSLASYNTNSLNQWKSFICG